MNKDITKTLQITGYGVIAVFSYLILIKVIKIGAPFVEIAENVGAWIGKTYSNLTSDFYFRSEGYIEGKSIAPYEKSLVLKVINKYGETINNTLNNQNVINKDTLFRIMVGIIFVESGGVNGIVGDSGNSLGLMQLQSKAIQDVARNNKIPFGIELLEAVLNSAETNIYFGVNYYTLMYSKYANKNYYYALAAYNQGPNNFNKYPYNIRGQKYANKVLRVAKSIT